MSHLNARIGAARAWEKNLRSALNAKALSAYVETRDGAPYVAFEKGNDFIEVDKVMQIVYLQFGGLLNKREDDAT